MPTRPTLLQASEIAGASLRTFMRLPVAQRSSVILMDVLGCSLKEVCEVIDSSLPAVKAALHRGRAQLRELAEEPDDRRGGNVRRPSAIGSAPMSRTSMRATSTPSVP